jgi:inorganic pyrophosphatase
MKTLFNTVVILAGIYAVREYLNRSSSDETIKVVNDNDPAIELVGTWEDFDETLFYAYAETMMNRG